MGEGRPGPEGARPGASSTRSSEESSPIRSAMVERLRPVSEASRERVIGPARCSRCSTTARLCRRTSSAATPVRRAAPSREASWPGTPVPRICSGFTISLPAALPAGFRLVERRSGGAPGAVAGAGRRRARNLPPDLCCRVEQIGISWLPEDAGSWGNPPARRPQREEPQSVDSQARGGTRRVVPDAGNGSLRGRQRSRPPPQQWQQRPPQPTSWLSACHEQLQRRALGQVG